MSAKPLRGYVRRSTDPHRPDLRFLWRVTFSSRIQKLMVCMELDLENCFSLAGKSLDQQDRTLKTLEHARYRADGVGSHFRPKSSSAQ